MINLFGIIISTRWSLAHKMYEFYVTLLLFFAILFAVPFFATSYVVQLISTKIWLFAMSLRYPHVEFLQTQTIRSLLDTHRNQGIISVLLSIRGQAQPEAVRRHLHEVVRRRDKSGNLAFPRLRHCLVTRCGTYAWERGKFDLDQNLTVAPVVYKGRAVTEHNIQEYVCEIVSKYLPQGIAPWQMIIIPSSEDQHYILLKLHHVLLNEKLNIGDLLPLIPPTRQPQGTFTSKSPLVNVLKKPTAIPNLKQALSEEIANRWNEFVSNYDPLECIELLKTNPGFFQMHAILIIAIISTLRESRRGFQVIQNNLFSKSKYVFITLKKECRKRRLTFLRYITSIFVTLDPRNIFKFLFVSWKRTLFLPLMLLIRVYLELAALYSCVVCSYCKYSNTLVGTVYNYVPQFYNSLKEVLYYLKIIFYGPRTIIEDILLQKETLQTVTLCGRKSVAWSDPVRTERIRAIARHLGVSEVEVMLGAISACLSKYFTHTKHLIPDYLPITIRNINSTYIFGTGANLRPGDAFSGVLCLNLAILDPEKEVSILENLALITQQFQSAIEKQGLSHLLSLCQTKFGVLTKLMPVSVLGVYLRFLSRKYAVSVTEITSRYPNVTQRTLWGQEVSSVIYWRPPQANSSVSLCLNEYAEHIKLGVMCDSQLAPHHPIFARSFPEYVQELGRSAGVEME